ncbi:MAG TPA: sigma-70 family RNA polymerase sigma factor [Pyrinomonadaceae bacterium]|jgi:RNA polymerase sigma factor (sigma-70 family)|nr:sigma-70 family RNA polymerase sigma factor [Pyrinomonadaceae bacterium]
MAKQWVLTKEALDNLLDWLDTDREQAGKKYEEIRQNLVKIFTWRGYAAAEDLADETINRVTRKVPEFIKVYSGDPALYFYGVARNLLLEQQKSVLSRSSLLPPDLPDASTREEDMDKRDQELSCLEHCLKQLSASSREFVLNYYQKQKQAKIDFRRELAQQLGISSNNLRVKMHRIRALLYDCILRCLQASANEMS